jgi:hypothetical protein
MIDTPASETPRLGWGAAASPLQMLLDALTAERMLLTALLALVLPLPFMGDLPAAPTLLLAGTGAMVMAIAALAALRGTPLPVPIRRLALPSAALALALAWTALQATPLVPASWQHPVWDLARDALGGGVRGWISLDPAATRDAALSLLLHVAVLWSALQLCRASAQAWLATAAFAAMAVVITLATLLPLALRVAEGASFIGAADIVAYPATPATLAGLGLLAALALALDRIVAAAEPGMRLRRAVRVAAKVLAANAALPGLGVAVLAVAAGALGGLHATTTTALAAALFLPAVALAPSLGFGGRRAVLAAIVAGTALIVAAAGATAFLAAPSMAERPAGTASAAALHAAAADAALFGTGLGTYEEAIKAYGDVDEGSARAATPSVYARLLIELGMPATALLALAGLSLVALLALGLHRRRRNAVYPALALAAMLLVGVASLRTPSLAPAVSLGYALLLGIGCAQSFETRRR